ncbi:sirohydrochlorin cobaltochelatase [Anaerospora hongkongensis]|uniref:Sirohydrochlorin cobaltochelatase n=1 Tax=Anaerospora hongkongensis TaxID=244830 RepID=A0A4R1PW59_9FIRM|nr:sirohydrochlorin cobaltochelatase [Anaerospora hongkongensis]TCL36566.1 sirohydrochlorin cobaltochelatase [Anaerospora hongkongensis]
MHNTAKKKAILVVSFGSTYEETRKKNIESTENKIRSAFPGYDVFRAFTSRMVIRRLAERDGLQVDTEKQALERLQAAGYQEVYVQPLHIVAGEEYDKVKRIVAAYAHAKEKAFERIAIGRPLLYYMGQEEQPDDYLAVIEAVKSQLGKPDNSEALVFMGHGGVHPANAAYAVLQMKLEQAGFAHSYVYTVEGFPSFESVREKLQKQKVRKVKLMPFMLVAGDHANNDMAGDEPDSAKSQLLAAGFEVETQLTGLGENAAIQELYVQHLKDAIAHPGHKCHQK